MNDQTEANIFSRLKQLQNDYGMKSFTKKSFKQKNGYFNVISLSRLIGLHRSCDKNSGLLWLWSDLVNDVRLAGQL